MKRPGEIEWSQAKCLKSIGPRSYLVESGGRKYRRNRRQLKLTEEQLTIPRPENHTDDDDDPPSARETPANTFQPTDTPESQPQAMETPVQKQEEE